MKAEKRKPVRPRKLSAAKKMREAIEAYFSACDRDGRPYTLEGMSVALDITREMLAEYEAGADLPIYSQIVKKAKTRIQQNLVERGLGGNNRSSLTIFLLKNDHGYEEGATVGGGEDKLIKGLTKEQAAEILADE